jgi:cell division protein FtsQ
MVRGRQDRRWRLVRARREAVPKSVRRFSERIRLRLRGPVPWLAGGLAVVVVAALAWVALATSVLGVREIRVTGSKIAGVERVRNVAGVAEGTPLARVDVDAVRTRVRTLPSVADVVVRRAWPTTLVIDVSERVAVASVAVNGGYLVLDAAGVVFTTATDRPQGLVLLQVARVGPAEPATQAALRVLAALTPALRSQLRELVADSSTRIRLELTGGRKVLWGDAEESEMKARVATSLLSNSVRTIDVSAPEVVTVR